MRALILSMGWKTILKPRSLCSKAASSAVSALCFLLFGQLSSHFALRKDLYPGPQLLKEHRRHVEGWGMDMIRRAGSLTCLSSEVSML